MLRILCSFVKSGHHVNNLFYCFTELHSLYELCFVQEISKMKSSYSQVLQQMEQLNNKLNQVSNRMKMIGLIEILYN